MLNPIIFASLYIPLFVIPLIYLAYTYLKNKYKQTHIVLYVHDNLTCDDASAMTMAEKDGPTTSILRFGTLLTHNDPITVTLDPKSKQIARAQGMYVNSQLDGKAVYMIFPIMFTGGEYKGSTLEIQGVDFFMVKEREFSVVSGTSYFRFVRRYGIMTTEFLDLPNLRAIIKLNITRQQKLYSKNNLREDSYTSFPDLSETRHDLRELVPKVACNLCGLLFQEVSLFGQ